MQFDLANRLFEASADIRYVALYHRGALQLSARPDLADANDPESDRYEELLVNPTLLTLARQRGNIDCGGLEFIVVRHGTVYQLIHPITAGHLSVAIERTVDPLELVEVIRREARAEGLLAT